jgi:hypothetical protein
MNGNREDLVNVLVNISPEETPLLSGFKKTKAAGKLHEWMNDELSPGANGRVVEGSDATAGTLQQRTRVGNYCQINRKAFQVSDSQNAGNLQKAGIGSSEYEYQLSKALKEIATDIEVDLVSGVSAAGDSATARAARGVLDFTSTNNHTGAAGGDSAEALTEDMYNDSLQAIYAGGGNPDTTYCNGFQKRKISAFTGSQTRNIEASSKKLIASLEVYESDFGLQRVILDRYMPTDTVAQLQKDMWKVAMYRPVKHTPLAKTGSSMKGMCEAEWTLEACAEKSGGKITELTTS